MNITNFSTRGLLMMHNGIRESLTEDDKTPADKEKPYCVRECTDWRVMSDVIEAELKKRNVTFHAIPW